MIALALLVAGVIGLGVVKMRRLRDQLTATEPAEVPVVDASAQQARELNREYSTLKEAIQKGRATTLTLTADELNRMVATVPQLKDFRGRVHFTIEDDRLGATASIPLDQIPGFQGRYLNGDFDLQVRCQNGVLEVYATQVTVKDKPLPEKIMNKLRQQNLAQKLYEDPDTVDKLKNIESIRVADGTVIIVTKQRK
jgi:hypothetical protein